MKAQPFEVGRIVLSKQGHDKGRWAIVIGRVDERHVLIVDGRLRRMDKPKKKQCKHLYSLPIVASEVAKAIQSGKPLLDSDVRKALAQALSHESVSRQDLIPNNKKEECALVQK